MERDMVMAAIASKVEAPIDQGGLDVPPPDHQHSRYVVVADAKNSPPSANKLAIRTGD